MIKFISQLRPKSTSEQKEEIREVKFNSFLGLTSGLALVLWLFWPTLTLGALPNDNVFTISPARQEIALSAGQSKIVSLKIINQSTQTQSFNLTIKDLEATQEGRGFTFSDSNDSNLPYRFSQLDVSLPRTIKILPGETKFVPIEISVPANWPPASLHGLVNVALDQNVEDQSNAKINTSVGVIILIRLSGQVEETGQLLRFNALSFWLGVNDPLRLQIAYQNDGNVYLNPYGLITIKNWRGQEIKTVFLDPWFILPQAIRNREVSIAGPRGRWWPGWYRAELKLNLGFNNQISSSQSYFIVSPRLIWNLTALAIVLGGLYLGFKARKHD